MIIPHLTYRIFAIFFLVSFALTAQVDLSAVDSITQSQIDNRYFEGTVLLADKGKVIYRKEQGLRDREAGIPIDGSTHYSIASITKMVTAIITLQLIEDDMFQLDDPLEKILPEVEVATSDKITPHHLLLHISGLPNEREGTYSKPIAPTEFVAMTLKDKKAIQKPGSFNYANIDYVLLGLLIEKYTGMSWEDNVKERILEPLNMTETGFLKQSDYPDNFAWTYTLSANKEFIKDPSFAVENFYAAACMYSTADDLLKLDQGMHGEKLLSQESQDIMFTSYPEYNYTGYSVWTYSYPFVASQPRIMERRGGIMGANVVLMRFLDLNRTIIILSNNSEFDPDSFGDRENFREALITVMSY